jgi:AraC family transcriptional regulator
MSVKVITRFPDTDNFSFNSRKWNRQFLDQNIILNGKFSYLYYPKHWTTLSLKFAFGGYEYYILDNIRYGVDNSSYLILNRDSVYESLINSEKPVESLTLNFTSDFVNDIFHNSFNNDDVLLDYPEIRDKVPVNFFQKLYRNDEVVSGMINSLREMIRSETCSSAYINERLHMVLEHVFRTQLSSSREADEIPSKKRSTRYELYNRLNIAKDYLYSNYSGKIELKELGKIVCLSPHHLLRKFRAGFGITPHKYLTNIRLEKARELVTQTDMPISQICFDVGFESLSSFGMLFKKHYSQSPENYRLSISKKSILKQ